ncbi:MAG: MarR family EPS-associated transcriptional regulator [Betaproteobacteria bacterium]|nr:MarR family EPS-associated transcriptional regulator [Betaproteobacteria bacterium]
MMSKRAEFQEDIQFQVLRRLHETPDISQRTLAKELGISLGSINFCFQALMEKGWVKMQNFSHSKHKMGYVYLLTPSGIIEKSKLTAQFLKRKMGEYEALKYEIETLRSEIKNQPSLQTDNLFMPHQ